MSVPYPDLTPAEYQNYLARLAEMDELTRRHWLGIAARTRGVAFAEKAREDVKKIHNK